MIQNAFTILELETKCIGMHQLHGVAPIIYPCLKNSDSLIRLMNLQSYFRKNVLILLVVYTLLMCTWSD